MPARSNILWCHSTVNPVAGCDGCPLWPSVPGLEVSITNEVARRRPAADRPAIRSRIQELVTVHHGPRRITQAEHVLHDALTEFAPDLAKREGEAARREIKSAFRCYAGVMSQRFAGTNPGYPANFDIAQKFRGRTAASARLGPPTTAEIADKPWMAGMKRLIFVSDMGDALSAGIDFPYLRQEIVDVAVSPKGQRHMWLWLTKRPGQMAEFYDWLSQHGGTWPGNLIPMASILNPGYARQATAIMRIPALIHGFSVEPLGVPLQLPAELLTPTSWVIVGGESGVGAKHHPFDLQWARDIRDQCRAGGASFFLKQVGANAVLDGQSPPWLSMAVTGPSGPRTCASARCGPRSRSRRWWSRPAQTVQATAIPNEPHINTPPL